MNRNALWLYCLIIVLIPLLGLPIYHAQAGTTYTITTSLEDVYGYPDAVFDDWTTWIKWNVSSIPLGYSLASATMRLYITISFPDHDVTVFRIANQTWVEENSIGDLGGMTTTEEGYYAGYSDTGDWADFDVIEQFKVNYEAGLGNFSVRMEDPDYPPGDQWSAGESDSSSETLRIGRSAVSDFYFRSKEHTNKPQLIVTLYSPTFTAITVEYDFPTATDQTSTIVGEEFWNDTQLLYKVPLHVYEDSSNVTVSELDQSWTFAYINPNASYTDTISSNGQIIFTDLYESEYEVLIDPAQDWHTLHISLYGPDGVGLLWESFPIYINDSRIPYPPEYRLETGYYEYEVEDYFSQTVLSGDFTIYAADPEHVYQNWEVPLYEVSFHNGDLAPYRLEITRNAITREYPLPPKGETHVRLYGLAANVAYTIEIYNADNEQRMDAYTLNVPNHPMAKYANYDDDEAIDFPPYNWIEERFNSMDTRITGLNQLVVIGFIGLVITAAIQTRAWLRGLFAKPLVKETKRR